MSESKRVLLHLTASSYGGVETHVYYLSLVLAARGAQVTLTSQRKLELNQEWTRSLLQAGVRLVAPPAIAKKLPGGVGLMLSRIALSRRLPVKSFDRVVGNGHGGAFAWMKRFVRPGGMFLWHEYWYGVPMRGDNYREYKVPPPVQLGWKMRGMINELDGIVTGCERAQRNLLEVQKARVPIRVIPPLTQLEAISQAAEKKYERGSTLCIVMVARMGYGKGLGALLEAWKDLDIGNAELHLYGPISSEFAVATKRRYEHEQTIHFHGSFDRAALPGILENADLGLMLSIEEGYGLVVSEYMACGLPFVMTDCGAAPEFTRDNPDAMMVPVSVDGVREGIREMSYRIRQGKVSRVRLQNLYKERFAFDIAAAEHLRALLGPVDYWLD